MHLQAIEIIHTFNSIFSTTLALGGNTDYYENLILGNVKLIIHKKKVSGTKQTKISN